MAEELAEVIEDNTRKGLPTRAIIPCGPKCWYVLFADLVNRRSPLAAPTACVPHG